MKRIDKREFLRLSVGGVAASTLPMSLRGQMRHRHGGGTGATVIDPPSGGPFADPVEMPNLSTMPGVVEARLTASRSPIEIAGVAANLLAYNGSFPGPTIRVRRGDTLRINFTNSLPALGTNLLGHRADLTNLHTHGLHVSPLGKSDNVMLSFAPGDSFQFQYDLTLQHPGSFNFYHPHVHGSVAEQYWAGLVGALIVEDPSDVLSGYETHLMVLKDITLNGGVPEPHGWMMEYMHGKEGNLLTVNGRINPVLKIAPGQVQRWRILNGSTSRFYYLNLQNHHMYIIGTDSGLIDRPYRVSSMLLAPGERLDVLVQGSATTGTYKFLALPYARQGMMTSAQTTLLTLSCQGSKATQAFPDRVNPEATRLRPPADSVTRQLFLGMGHGQGFINGIAFSETNSYQFASQLGTHEIWEIVNESGMDHPFHQHVNPGQVLSISGGDPVYSAFVTTAPAWKDTVLVPKWGSVRILIPILDYEGMSMFHCHILEHEDIGMMGMWDIMGLPT